MADQSAELYPHISTEMLKRWRAELLGPGALTVIAQLARELLTREIDHPARKARDPAPVGRMSPVNDYRRFAADVSSPIA